MNTAGDRESILARFAEGPALLERTLSGLRDSELDARPAGGGWTIRQIVHHVVDGDDFWKLGIKAALGNDQCEFTFDWYWAFPQDVWADRWAYANRSLDVSMALLTAARAHVLQLLEQIPDGWSRTITIRKLDGKTERLSVGAIVEMQADHIAHHLKRILAIHRECGST